MTPRPAPRRVARAFERLTLATFALRVAAFPFTRRITQVHLHHTWSPDRAAWRGEATVRAMWRYHVEQNGWSDLAQHVTVAPDGGVWLGRDWNRPPASSTGFNGTSQAGPFMLETVGNFDRGHDALDGPQRVAVLGVIAAVQVRFELAPGTMRFHRQLNSPKSCPGSSLDYDAVLHELTAYRTQGACP